MAPKAFSPPLSLLLILLLLHARSLHCDVTGGDGFTPMKIVNEISNAAAWNSNNNNHQQQPSSTSSVSPAEFVGPAHLRPLADECFDLYQADYRYRLCPFRNVTQHETASRWNAYHGVLGVWREWRIADGRFAAMLFHRGESCGADKERRVEVMLECGAGADDDVTRVTSAEEWEQCRYRMTLESPLFCSGMAVYNYLNETRRAEWLSIEQDFVDGFLTPSGYEAKIVHFYSRVFPATEEEVGEVGEKFESLDTCNEEYGKLLETVERLKRELKEARKVDG